MGSGGSVPLSSRQSVLRGSGTLCEHEELQGHALPGLHVEEPTDSQGPSPYATLRRDDLWHQGPSAPSLPGASSIRSSYAPHQETLLAYASQMTGWQTGPGAGSNLGSTRSEVTELSKTVSCLAAANQQLAAAHGAALSHLETLYRDLRSSRISQGYEKDFGEGERCEEGTGTRASGNNRSEEDEREKRQTLLYVARLESLLATRSRGSHYEDEKVSEPRERRVPDAQGRVDEEKEDLRNALARIEELEDTLRNERLTNVSKCEKGVQCEEEESLNEELKKQLEVQRQRIERLESDCKESTVQRERAESQLQERGAELERLSRDLDLSKSKRMGLLREVDSFRTERDSALVRISSLEEELQKTILDRDNVKTTEGQKSAKLKAQLAEEVADKKKQIKALEDALEEIQQLKLAVKTEKNAEPSLKESCSETAVALESVYEATEEMPDDMTCSRVTNMEEFKKELTLKREARQRAIAAVSSEMDRLRRELGAEKEAHSETSRMLDLLKSGEPAGEVREPESNQMSESCTEEETKKLQIKLEEEKEAHEETSRRITAQQITDTLKVSDEIKNFVRFEVEKLEDLRYHLEQDEDKHEQQISELKETVAAARLVLATREQQVNKLKDQLAHILAGLGGRNHDVISDDARAEFDHQLENLRNLKTLYEVRLKVLIEMKEHAAKELAETKEKLEISQKKLKTLEEDLEKSEEKVDTQDTEISNLESQLGLTKADCRDLENQMSVINSLFTQMLLSASSADMDLDRLTRLLQENHDLISDMAREEGTEAAALPKLLLDLVEQVEGRSPTKPRASGGEGEKNDEDIQEENIAHNLPKVWRVLLELLSCHAADVPSASASELSAPDSCYKSVDTPTGPQLVISVSKTYIRLKELILEKKQLEKEMTRMKQLNTHLESKLGEQEKRLSTVSSELSKTWNIVGRMQAQHQQLHTHEKILRYELQQKRKMLQELKQELEYCREKWESARQKNSNTEMEWKNLRREFAARKALAVRDSLNNSGESGFSDERGDESDEEDDGRTERIRISPRRRTRKESPRVPSPDTESEQPTDTEISESKTCSSGTLEQRTPTPETETEVDAEMIDADSLSGEVRPPTPEPDCTPETEILDPLDRALTNVIQSLIKSDTASNHSSASTSRESLAGPSTSNGCEDHSIVAKSSSYEISKGRNHQRKRDIREWSPHSEPWSSSNADIKRTTLAMKKKDTIPNQRSSFDSDDVDENSSIDPELHQLQDSSRIHSTSVVTTPAEETLLENTDTLSSTETDSASPSTVSVFSIGPYPKSKSPSPVKTVQFREPLILGPSNTLNQPESEEVSNQDGGAVLCDEAIESNVETEPLDMLHPAKDSVPELATTSSTTEKDSSLPESEIKPEPCRSSGTESGQDKTPEPRVTSSLDQPSASSSSSSSGETSAPKATRTPEEILAARAARLKRLEEQADWLMKKMNATSQRGSALSTRLEELHEVYGEPPAPPPLPDVLPSLRLQTNNEVSSEDQDRQEPDEAQGELTAFGESESQTDANESPPNNAP